MIPWILGRVEVCQIQKKFDFVPAQALDAEQVTMREAGEVP